MVNVANYPFVMVVASHSRRRCASKGGDEYSQIHSFGTEGEKPVTEFPCGLPRKSMSERFAEFVTTIQAVVQGHAADITIAEPVTANSQETTGNIYRAGTSQPMAKYVL